LEDDLGEALVSAGVGVPVLNWDTVFSVRSESTVVCNDLEISSHIEILNGTSLLEGVS